MIRQGDILVRPVVGARLQTGTPVAPEGDRVVLAHGEVTGHHHSLALSSRVAMFRDDAGGGGALRLSVTDAPVVLEHQEHTALRIEPGVHDVVRQRTYTAGIVRRVVD